MIEIRITKEIGNFKPKFLGPFNLRQVVCILIAAPICIGIYKFTSGVLPSDLPGFLCAIPAGIAWLFGWYEPYGMPTEKFLQSIAVNVLLAPSNRRYKTANTVEKVLHDMDESEEKDAHEQKGSGKEKHDKKHKSAKRPKDSKPEFYL